MKMHTDLGFFRALTSVCCLMLAPACAGGEGESPFGVDGELADDGDIAEDDDGQEAADEAPADEPADDMPADDEPADGEPADDEPADGEPADDAPPVDEPPVDEPPVDEPPVDEPPVDEPPVDEPLQAEEDFDHQANPAVFARFRHTSPNPVSVDAPLFNDTAIDTKGLQYLGAVSDPGDHEDWIQFQIVPGENDPTIGLYLDCETPDVSPQPLRAHLIHENGTILETVVCGDDEQSVNLVNASSTTDYFVRIEVTEGWEYYGAYTLEIDGHCTPSGCVFSAI